MPLLVKNDYGKVLSEIKKLCNQLKHKEAYDLLMESMDISKLESIHDQKEFYYYKGITSLIGLKNFSDAHYNFNLGLALSDSKSIDFIDILSTNGVAIAYFMDNDAEKARTYFEKSISELEEFRSSTTISIDSVEAAKIYFNTANFYSKEKEYNQTLKYVEMGITLYQIADKMSGFENLLYLKAYALYKSGEKEKSTNYYLHAASMARLNRNNDVIKAVNGDTKEFGFPSFDYYEKAHNQE